MASAMASAMGAHAGRAQQRGSVVAERHVDSIRDSSTGDGDGIRDSTGDGSPKPNPQWRNKRHHTFCQQKNGPTPSSSLGRRAEGSFVLAENSTDDRSLFESILQASENGTKRLQPPDRSEEAHERRKHELHHTVEAYRKQLYHMERTTINPQGKLSSRWDALVSLALVFTAFFLPYEIGFLPTSFSLDTFVVNRTLDGLFLIDTVLHFFTPYRDKSENVLGTWVYDNRKIASHYVRGSFPVDAISLIPFDVVVMAAESGGGSGGGSAGLRMLRMMRIIKLARILRASHIIDRWENHWGVSYAKTALIKFFVYALMTAHWMACLWGFAAKITGGDAKELRTVGGVGNTWIERAGLQEATAFELYVISVYVALNNVFGSTPEINPSNVTEFVAQCVMIVCGSAVWAFIIGSSCGIIATLDPSSVEYRHTMDELNYLMTDKKFPQEHKVRLRSFFSQTMHRIRTERYETLFDRMSMRLRGETALLVARGTLKKVSYLAHPELESDFLSKVSLVISGDVFARHERIACTKLIVIERGITSKRGKIALMGSCYGEDMILNNPRLRDTSPATALTFVQVLLLDRADMYELVQDYPIASAIIRKAAVLLAFKRAVIRVATVIRNLEQHSIESYEAYKKFGGVDKLVQRMLGHDLTASYAAAPYHVAEQRPSEHAEQDMVVRHATAPRGAHEGACRTQMGGLGHSELKHRHSELSLHAGPPHALPSAAEGAQGDVLQEAWPSAAAADAPAEIAAEMAGGEREGALGTRLRNVERRLDAHHRHVNKRMDDLGDLLMALHRKTDQIATGVGTGEESAPAAAADARLAAGAEGDFRSLRRSKADALREPIRRKAPSLTASSIGNLGGAGGVRVAPSLAGNVGDEQPLGTVDGGSRLPWRRSPDGGDARDGTNGPGSCYTLEQAAFLHLSQGLDGIQQQSGSDNLLSGRLEA